MGYLQSLHQTDLIVTEPTDIAMSLKPVRARRLRDGMWVVVAKESEPLVVSETVAKTLQEREEVEALSVLNPLIDTLSDAGFMSSSTEAEERPSGAPVSFGWKTARTVLWMIGATFFLVSIVLLLHGGMPTGADIISAGSHPLLAIAVATGIAIVTAVPHELGHAMFGNVLGYRHNFIRIQARQATATTNLTHVWTWPLSPRLAAVTAGLIIDLGFLTLALLLRIITASWIATIAVSVIVLRILWQFRFHRNCDGRHIAKMLLDDPLIDVKTKEKFTTRSRISIPHAAYWWLILIFIGILVELALLAVWFAPAVLKMLGAL
jgi:hypothetical protein